MGVRLASLAALCALAAWPALAQKSTEDGLRDCEKLVAVKLKQENFEFKKFSIARADVEEDKFADKVGTAPAEVRFICLHGGLGKGAVFVYTLPR